jgi:hypothetical protein
MWFTTSNNNVRHSSWQIGKKQVAATDPKKSTESQRTNRCKQKSIPYRWDDTDTGADRRLNIGSASTRANIRTHENKIQGSQSHGRQGQTAEPHRRTAIEVNASHERAPHPAQPTEAEGETRSRRNQSRRRWRKSHHFKERLQKSNQSVVKAKESSRTPPSPQKKNSRATNPPAAYRHWQLGPAKNRPSAERVLASVIGMLWLSRPNSSEAR